jgi:hypothetical protein
MTKKIIYFRVLKITIKCQVHHCVNNCILKLGSAGKYIIFKRKYVSLKFGIVSCVCGNIIFTIRFEHMNITKKIQKRFNIIENQQFPLSFDFL